MSANIPNDPVAIQKFFTSRDNNANSASYVGQEQRLWYDPITNAIYVSDGTTPGGILVGGGGSGNGVPGGLANTVQFNAGNGMFGGSSNFTFDGANVAVTGNVSGNYFIGNGSQLTGINVSSNIIFNGNSNVQIASADANVTVDVNGVSNVAVFTTTGVDVTGNITATNTIDANLVTAENGLFLNANVVTANYTIPPGYNALSAGPITIPDGIVVDSIDSNWGIV
jgi:hypothetical protein